MKNYKIRDTAALPGLIAIAAILLSLLLPISMESIAGFGTVLVLLGMAVLEYRPNTKLWSGR